MIVTINDKNNLLRFMSVYGLKESAAEELKYVLANRINDRIILARFSVARADVLMADYYLPFEGGIPTFQIVIALRLFARVVLDAIRSCDDDSIVE